MSGVPIPTIVGPVNGAQIEAGPHGLRPDELSTAAMMEADAAGVGESPPKAEERPRGEAMFEIIIPSSLAGVTEPVYHLKIWGDGVVEGFEKLGDTKSMLVMNRFPMMLDQVMQPLRNYVADVDAELNRIAPPAEKAP